MILSKSCEYAIKATIYIAGKSRDGKKSGIIEISNKIGSPQYFTAKILQTLVKENVLQSAKGPSGGFYLDFNKQIHLIDIVKAIDGDAMFSSCALGLKKCSSTKPCPIHEQIAPIRTELLQLFSKKSVEGITEDLDSGKVFLIN
jgi:Rrf2 family protein